MEKKKIFGLGVILIVIVIFIIFLFSSENEQSKNNNEILLGAILHLTNNDYSHVGVAMQEGIELAINEINVKGGINGQLVHVIYEDSQNNNLKALNAAQKLIEIDQVQVVFVSTYGEAMAIGSYFEEKKIPLVVLWDANEDIQNLGEYVFSTGVWTKASGTRIADFAYQDLGVKRVGVIYHSTEWSESVTNYFKEEFIKLGGEITIEEKVLPETVDFKTHLLKVQERDPDAIFAPIDRNLDIFFKQIKSSGFQKYVLSSDAVTQMVIDNAKGGAEGIYYTTIAVPQNEYTTNFVDKYKSLYKKEPQELIYVGFGYDGAKVILNSLTQGAKNPQEVKKYLYQVQSVEGSFSLLTMNSKGSIPKLESVFTVHNGEETFVKE